MKPEYILGISAFYHDSAACLLKDGDLVAAAQEERFTRRKHDADFPIHAIRYCLESQGISVEDLDWIAFYDKPFIKFERILETYLTYAPRGVASFIRAIPLWIRKKLWIPDLIQKKLNYQGKILFPEHHESHAASAFFPSPFREAAFLTIDGVGEWATASYGIGRGNRIQILAELHFPHSLGLLYSAFTYFTGFKVNSGEYKVMGLAPYGEPRYVQTILEHLIDLKEDGSFRVNMDYFDYGAGLRMTGRRFEALFGGPPRQPETPLTQREMDLARSIQEVTEEIVLRMARHVKKETGQKYLCLAGGVALNCVANGKLLRSGLFEDIWIQPAAGDAGGAIGAAYIVHHHYLNHDPLPKNGRDLQKGSYLGPEYDDHYIQAFLDSHRLPYRRMDDEELFDRVADLLQEGKVVGWFQGRMEFGPRALGNRSILGDPRSPDMQRKMNLKIKFRESFRPFAPAVLLEHVSEWFQLDRESPYMLLVAEVAEDKKLPLSPEQEQLRGLDKLKVPRSQIPAVTHVDNSARIQTVRREDNPRFYALIERFYQKTGCPILVNTSFNVRGEPIVASPVDAYRCFMRTEMDVLVLGNFVLFKDGQPEYQETLSWQQVYELD
ncbi:MAG: carbamoyltransferase [Calditrichaeota bacterium]|nr:carbamoyltransferase [Calditrichota bacterium]